ncbi:MAG: hypothetical protein AB7L92_03685 [Alphaproteobacteria bacterium]
MLGRILSSAFKVRVALWAMRRLAFDGTGLKLRMQASVIAAAALACCMMLTCFVVIGLLVMLGLSLFYFAQFNLPATLAITFATLGMLIVGLYAYAMSKLKEALRSSHTQQSFDRHPSKATAIVDGFLEGFRAPPARPSASVEPASAYSDGNVMPIRTAQANKR